MKRKVKNTSSMIYTYGLHPPKIGANVVSDQLRLSARYYNKLVEIERARRVACENYLTANSPGLAAATEQAEKLKAEVEVLAKRVADEKMHARTKRQTMPTSTELVAKRKELKAAWLVVKDIKKKAYAESAEAIKAITSEHNELVKKARSENGLYYGTYLLIEKAMEQTRKSKAPPSFKRFTGEGRLGVHYNGGCPHHKLMEGTDTQMRIVDRHALKPERKTLHFRVKSDEKHKPIWAVFDAILHRPMPDDAVVKDAWIKVTNRGWRKDYELQMSLEMPASTGKCPGTGAVGIDLGWRSMDSAGVRAGYVVDGKIEEQILVPEKVISQWEHSEGLQSLRDKNFNIARGELLAWLREVKASGKSIPEWLQEISTHLHLWRSASRLAWHVKRWQSERFEGDELILPALVDWRHRDNHIGQWAIDDRRKALNRRKDFYRVLCSKLAQKYAVIYIEDFDLRKMSRRPAVEGKESHQEERARSKKYKAAPSELRNILTAACSRYGVQLVKVPCEYTTLTCHLCGHCDEWDAAPKIEHTCLGCGATWDQDLNAAHNILRLGSSGSMVLKADKPVDDGEIPMGGDPTLSSLPEEAVELDL